ncbi:glycosyltransferase [Cytobacillus gottheilii]|uniref:Glycosyltransferase n=1 Tax=Cytobacillus gottheilii TaxID=859144 RepID=A0ABX8F589_9BACI|nr:glycosyltransferase [Cytobacillus gottheilii]QVY59645.1 glycosyltransferase [Cytobacillus gottheilii]
MGPKVSIIIPFYNCAYIDQSIQSALNQTYKNIEIIVVDDGSFAYMEKIQPYLNSIRYVKKENGGTATALNYGVSIAKGSYVAWLSSDDYFLPEKIEKQLDFMLKRNAKASFTNYDCVDENNHIITKFTGMRFQSTEQVYESYLKYNTINGCTVLIDKNELKRFGIFNPTFRYTHDYELWFKMLVNGVDFYYLDENLTKFRQHSQSGTSMHQDQMRAEMAIIEEMYRPLLLAKLQNIK